MGVMAEPVVGRCTTCQWWGYDPALEVAPEARHGVPLTWHACGLTDWFAEGRVVDAEDPVVLLCGIYEPHGDAELMTAPTFGCVQWVARS